MSQVWETDKGASAAWNDPRGIPPILHMVQEDNCYRS